MIVHSLRHVSASNGGHPQAVLYSQNVLTVPNNGTIQWIPIKLLKWKIAVGKISSCTVALLWLYQLHSGTALAVSVDIYSWRHCVSYNWCWLYVTCYCTNPTLCVAARSVDMTCCYFVELPVMTVLPRAANWCLSECFCAAFRLNRVAAKRQTKCFNLFYLNFVTLSNLIILTNFL